MRWKSAGWVSVAFLLAGPGCSNGISPQTAESACVLFAACGPGGQTASCEVQLVFGAITAAQRQAVACVAGAGASCASYRRCVGVTDLPAGTACNRCDGSAVVYCATGATGILRQDCNWDGSGSTCDASGGFPRCIPPGCAAGGADRCEADRVISCTRGYVEYCPAQSTCGTDPSGAPACVGTGPTCVGPRCSGTVFVGCEGGREGPTFDCGIVGATCSVETVCAPTRTECVPSTTTDTCTGDVLDFCRPDGTLGHFNCSAHGYLGCTAGHCIAP